MIIEKIKNNCTILTVSIITSTSLVATAPVLAQQPTGNIAAWSDPSFQVSAELRYSDQALKGEGLEQKSQFDNLMSSRYSLREYFEDPEPSKTSAFQDVKLRYKTDHESFFDSVDRMNNCPTVSNSINFNDTGWDVGAIYQSTSDTEFKAEVRYQDRVTHAFDKYGSSPDSFIDTSYNSCIDMAPANEVGQSSEISDRPKSSILYGLLGIAALGGIFAVADSNSPTSP